MVASRFIGYLLGFGGPDIVSMIVLPILACCAIFSCYKCAKCRIRDCRCCKRWMRTVGADQFDDFDLLVVVHEALYTASTYKLSTYVRVTAGRESVSTDVDSRGIFQQPLSIFVEQGEETILVELLDAQSTVLANHKLNVERDIKKNGVVRDKVFTMKQKKKGILNPRIKLTIREDLSSEEDSLLSKIAPDATAQTQMLLMDQLLKAQEEGNARQDGKDQGSPAVPLSELDVLAKSCAGRLEMFGDWGKRKNVYIAVSQKLDNKKCAIGIWDDQNQFQKGEKPKSEAELLKILGVQPDPQRVDVFLLNYVKPDKTRSQFVFTRVDRSRDVWVEMLSMLITKFRQEREVRKKIGQV